MKRIFIINGSASFNSSNERLIENVIRQMKDKFNFTVFNELKSLPHFDPHLSFEDPPAPVKDLRKQIEDADGVGAKFTGETSLLIQGVKGKVSMDGEITDSTTREELSKFVKEFEKIIASM